MNMGNESKMSTRFRQTSSEKRCPECGDKMRETDRCNENGTLFIWYECSRNDCDGQWLEKISRERLNGLQDGPGYDWIARL